MSELDYEKRIADYRASTDAAAVRWRDEVLRLDEKAQKKSFFHFAVADASRRWILITSARIEKTKCG